MVFSDLFFLFVFLPSFFLIYIAAWGVDKMRAQNLTSSECVSRTTWRNAALIVFSLLFYAWGEPIYVFLMLGSVAVNYVAGLLIDRSHRHRRLALAAVRHLQLSDSYRAKPRRSRAQ